MDNKDLKNLNSKDREYFIVDKSALPEAILKVIEVKRLLDSGKEKTIQSAAAKVGISRSAVYKYKDSVFPFYENSRGKTLTLALSLDNTTGLLSSVLNIIAKHRANVLTINQNIPLNNIANVTITIEVDANNSAAELMEELKTKEGVLALKIIARE